MVPLESCGSPTDCMQVSDVEAECLNVRSGGRKAKAFDGGMIMG